MSSTPTNPSFINGHPRDEGSPVEEPVSPLKETNHEDGQTSSQKKKKKKKSKKPKPAPLVTGATNEPAQEPKQPVLCISRNKHWKYISSYHGPWLQLPLELLESLLMLNMDPTNFLPRDERMPTPPNSRRTLSPSTALSLRNPNTPKSVPPPIDPGVFRSVTTIRRLIDEASDLAVRAASGLSASALGALRSPTMGNNPWGPNQMKNSLGDQSSGRGSGMSSTRTHRLRVLAVQKLAAAYKADEIAASVMVMQGASALDDLAERVLKVDPNDPDAKYVHFFHEKIPSRQLAESTTTQVLDELIEAQPTRLHYFRTRGIVRCFRDEYAFAIKDFTHTLKESRALRKARAAHHSDGEHKQKSKGRKRNEGKTNGQAPPNGTSVPDASPSDATPTLRLHPSVGPDAPEPLETQVLFLRAAAYLQNAVHLIEDAILDIEGVEKMPALDALELKLSLLEKGKYGGVTTEGIDGPLGSKSGNKLQAYRKALAVSPFRQNIATLLRKSIRDHERFMASFDTVDDALPTFEGDIAQRVETAFLLSESLRPGSQSPPPPPPENPNIFTTYHPLLVESYFSVLLCYFLLGDFVSLLPAYQRAAALVDGLEGYPVFLPARSMAQAEFIEILERLATTWSPGLQPHSLAYTRQQPQLIEMSPTTTATIVVTQSPLPSSATLVELQSDTTISTRTTSPINEDEGTSVSTSQSQSQIQETGQDSLALSLARPNGFNGINEDSSEQLLSPDGPQQNGRTKRQATQGSQGSQGSNGSNGVPEGSSDDPEHQRAVNLDCLRILLAPVSKRQHTRAENEAAEKANKTQKKKKSLSINIPLHSPRVDIVLAYVAAVHLPEFDV